MSESRQHTSRRTRKIAAIAAGLLVVGVGATYTLASWTDSEWVWGGAGGDDLIGTSQFNVQQNTTSPYVETGTWVDAETIENANTITFLANANSLVPGDTVYAPVALRTDQNSDPAEISLQPAQKASPEDTHEGLWDEIILNVYTQDEELPPSTCDANFDPQDWNQIVSNAALNTAGSVAQDLAGNGESVQHYCFVMALPDVESIDNPSDIQGRTITPAWEFKAESN